MKFFKTTFLIFIFSFVTIAIVLANPLKAIVEQGQKAYLQKDYKKTIKIFEKALELNPNFAPTYYYLGLSHRELKSDMNEVVYLFKQAVEIDPTHFHAHENLSKIYYLQGKFDLAEEHALKAVKLQPELLTAKLALAWVYLLGKEQPEDASFYFQEVLEKVESPYAYFGLGIAYVKQKNMAPVLGVITELRNSGYDHLAVQLERMMRENRYIVPVGMQGKPFLAPIKRAKSILVSDEVSTISYTKQEATEPVRIRSNTSKFSSPSLDSQESNKPTLSGVDRIRMLQQRNTKKGSGY
jgi:tetratricopeptide (TPR) repeat protein